jgi:peptidyl-prolyl cis-trans isomerase D
VLERKDLVNSEHHVAGIRATREAMKWIFDATPGQVSPLYECGSNDHLLVVALEKVHPVGYRDLDGVKDVLMPQVLRDKKYEALAKKLEGVKSIADAKAKGAVIDTVKQISFTSPVFVQATGSSEPALAGAVAATKAGEFHAAPVKGNGGAFLFQVLNVDQQKKEFNAKEIEAQQKQTAMQAVSRFMREIYQKARITDNRYLFI